MVMRQSDRYAKSRFRLCEEQSGSPAKRAARRPPFPQKLLAGPNQFAALLAGLSVEVLSAVVGAVALNLMPCKRSPAIFRGLSALASGGPEDCRPGFLSASRFRLSAR